VSFWIAVAATAALAFTANAPWLSGGGVDIDGQSALIRAAVPVDPVWIYAAAAAAAFGLLVFALTRNPAGLGLSALAAVGAIGVLVADARDLLEELDASDFAWGAHLLLASSTVLLIASLAGIAGTR